MNLTWFSRKGWDLSVGLVLETTLNPVQQPPGGRAEFGLMVDYNGSAGIHTRVSS
eukprot:SAG11_NODE_2244_length_3640_cov_2.296160_2_plen_55_part_00